jgi:hypothetical protein
MNFIILALVIIFVLWQLQRSDMIVPPNVEKPLTPKQALQYALDNGLPLKNALGETDGRNLIGHNGGPPLDD